MVCALLFSAPGLSVPSDCAPAVVVEGSAAAEVAALLAARGLSAPAHDCPSARVSVDAEIQGVSVRIVDTLGRTVQRHASTPLAAANLVDSWVRSDEAQDVVHPTPAPRAAAVFSDEPDSAPAVVPAWMLFDAVAETSVAFDGSVWPGASAGVCLHFSSVCAGVWARAAVDSSLIGASRGAETGRVGLDGYGSVDVAFDVAGLTVRPGVYVGAGWLQNRNAPVYAAPVEPNVAINTNGMRMGARVIVAVPVTDAFALDVSASSDVALLAHTTPFVEEGERFAGEPLGFVRLGIGFGVRR